LSSTSSWRMCHELEVGKVLQYGPRKGGKEKKRGKKASRLHARSLVSLLNAESQARAYTGSPGGKGKRKGKGKTYLVSGWPFSPVAVLLQ